MYIRPLCSYNERCFTTQLWRSGIEGESQNTTFTKYITWPALYAFHLFIRTVCSRPTSQLYTVDTTRTVLLLFSAGTVCNVRSSTIMMTFSVRVLQYRTKNKEECALRISPDICTMASQPRTRFEVKFLLSTHKTWGLAWRTRESRLQLESPCDVLWTSTHLPLCATNGILYVKPLAGFGVIYPLIPQYRYQPAFPRNVAPLSTVRVPSLLRPRRTSQVRAYALHYLAVIQSRFTQVLRRLRQRDQSVFFGATKSRFVLSHGFLVILRRKLARERLLYQPRAFTALAVDGRRRSDPGRRESCIRFLDVSFPLPSSKTSVLPLCLPLDPPFLQLSAPCSRQRSRLQGQRPRRQLAASRLALLDCPGASSSWEATGSAMGLCPRWDEAVK